jgi:hypothetical protein
MIVSSYFLSYACAETLENGVIEFDTYDEAFDAYAAHEVAGYAVVIRDHDVSGSLANEIRKGKGFTYTDRRTELVA